MKRKGDAASYRVPGEALGAPSKRAGSGTHLWQGEIRASLTGRHTVDECGIGQVDSPAEACSSSNLPVVGDVATCRVTRIKPRLANVAILCVGGRPLRESCNGVIRREDVRPVGLEPIEVYRSFRPGDIVMARIISLGDARAYFLSTADPHHGVVLARSGEGAVMRPVSYCEMECPVSKAKEPRKCAKPLDPPPKAAHVGDEHDAS